MSLKKTTGILLSSDIMGEADVKANFLCRDEGKKSFIFRGLKKSCRRPQSAAEPGAVVEIVYNEHSGREIVTARDFFVVKYFAGIRADFTKIICSSFLFELVERTTGFGSREHYVFDFLANALSSMEKTNRPLDLAVFFMIRLMKVHGIFAPAKRCKICGSEDFNGFVFDTFDMGVICKKCSPGNPNLLGREALEFVSESLSVKFTELRGYASGSRHGLLLQFSLFLEQYFSVKIHSRKLLLDITRECPAIGTEIL